MSNFNSRFQIFVLVLIAGGLVVLGGVYGYKIGLISGREGDDATLDLLLAYIKSERTRYEEVKDAVGRLPANLPAAGSLGDRREREIVSAVEKVSPAVVSIVVSKDVPKLEVVYDNPFGNDPFFRDFGVGLRVPRFREKGTERKRVGSGSGFIVSSDGLIVTNRHVAGDEEAEYAVLLTTGEQKIAHVIARDPKNDIAILKIDGRDLPTAPLGNSDILKPGQTVIAIGNALGELSNSVSVGIVSGLGRNISAQSGAQTVEQLYDVIQTDAAINPGNSGGPLLNTRGEVIGINVATVQGAQTIGFALPINDIKVRIEQVQKFGKIIRPFLGVRYTMVTPGIKTQLNLNVDDGAVLVNDSSGGQAVVDGSPAQKAGLQAGDVIVSVNSQPVNLKRPLDFYLKILNAGDVVKLEIVRGAEKLNVELELGELKI